MAWFSFYCSRDYNSAAGQVFKQRSCTRAEKWLVVVYREVDTDGFHYRIPDAPQAILREKEGCMETLDLESYLRFLPNVQHSPAKSVWMTYDTEADVLYVNYRKPGIATDSELTDDDVIIRYDGDEIIGFTVLHVSDR
jgi:uncharacterized protein YuzE